MHISGQFNSILGKLSELLKFLVSPSKEGCHAESVGWIFGFLRSFLYQCKSLDTDQYIKTSVMKASTSEMLFCLSRMCLEGMNFGLLKQTVRESVLVSNC